MDKPLPDTEDEAQFWLGFAQILADEEREEDEKRKLENELSWLWYDLNHTADYCEAQACRERIAEIEEELGNE